MQHVLVPTPIGVGPQYHPRPAVHSVCQQAPLRTGARVHIELFANRRVAIVPARIGVGPRCRARVWTLEPTGVVEVSRAGLTLGDFFAVWGRERLSRYRRAYVNGRRWAGALAAVPLRRHAEIVLEVGPFVRPHASFLFRKGL